MNRNGLLFIIACLFLLGCTSAPKKISSTEGSFRTDSLISAPEVDYGELRMINGTDDTALALHVYQSSTPPSSALLFLHGGGAHGQAGYGHLAHGLSQNDGVNVYLLDLRGHGLSQGPRGATPSIEQVWQDVKTSMDLIRSENPGLPLCLGGHSSGAGLLLNYITWNDAAEADGYVLISPYFGYKSNTDRADNPNPFAIADEDVFRDYFIHGGKINGNRTAVHFNYSQEILAHDPLLITSITCFMSLAMTPDNPVGQFSSMDKPFCLFVGDEDELFDWEKLLDYGQYPSDEIRNLSLVRSIPGEGHLSILLTADTIIAEFLDSISNHGNEH